MPGLKNIAGLLKSKGTLLLRKSLYIGRGLVDAIFGPPNQDNIIRRFLKRTGSVLIDSIASRNAQLLLPVSSFNGVDGSVATGIPANTITSASVFFKTSLNDGLVRVIMGAFDTSRFYVAVRNGFIAVGFEGSVTNTTSVVDDGIFRKIEMIVSGGTFNVLLNGVNIFSQSITLPIDSRTMFVGALNSGVASNFFSGEMHSASFNGILQIPYPHTGYAFDSNGDGINLTINGGVAEDYDENGSPHYFDYGAVLRSGNYIPNNLNSQPIFTIVAGDTFIRRTNFINLTPFKLRLFTTGDTDIEYTFFNRNIINAIWKSNTQAEDGLFDVTELNDEFTEDNIEDAYKWRWFIKIKDNQFEDLILYGIQLSGSDLDDALEYTDDKFLRDENFDRLLDENDEPILIN